MQIDINELNDKQLEPPIYFDFWLQITILVQERGIEVSELLVRLPENFPERYGSKC